MSQREEKLWKEFLEGIRDGNEGQVRRILLETKNPNLGSGKSNFLARKITTQQTLTVLHFAVKHGAKGIVKLLLENGVNVNATTQPHKFTALHMAVEQDDVGIIQLLLSQEDINVNACDEYGHTPLKLASEKGNQQTVKRLIEKGADVTIVDSVDNSAIHVAADKGHYGVLELLLSSEAFAKNPEIIGKQNKDKNTPLHLAVARECQNSVALLLSYGATSSLELENRHNETPKQLAKGNKVILELLENPLKAKQYLMEPTGLGVKDIGRSGSKEAGCAVYVSSQDGSTVYHLTINVLEQRVIGPDHVRNVEKPALPPIGVHLLLPLTGEDIGYISLSGGLIRHVPHVEITTPRTSIGIESMKDLFESTTLTHLMGPTGLGVKDTGRSGSKEAGRAIYMTSPDDTTVYRLDIEVLKGGVFDPKRTFSVVDPYGFLSMEEKALTPIGVSVDLLLPRTGKGIGCIRVSGGRVSFSSSDQSVTNVGISTPRTPSSAEITKYYFELPIIRQLPARMETSFKMSGKGGSLEHEGDEDPITERKPHDSHDTGLPGATSDIEVEKWFHEWKTWERSEWVARWKKRQDRFLSHRMLRRKLRNVVTTAIDFEANHKECVRVLPYSDDDDTKVHFYVFSGKSGVPQELKDAAQECFGEMKVKLEWFDLYNDATEILKATRIEFPSGKLERLNESQIYEINEAINKNLHVLVKHRNITAVQASFKITNSKQTKRPCIAIYVLGKGSIPLGEFQFPRTLGDYDVDVVDGFWFRTGKDDPWKPEKGQEPREVLRLGASIGVRGEKGCGTLGAILESDGNFYALSCDHVMKHPQREIIHPAQDDYLNYLNYHLQEYAKQIRYIIKREQRYILETQLSYGILKEVEPLNQKFQELKSIKKDHFDQQRAREENVEEANRHERALERGLRTPPRVIGRYNAGISHNVEWTNNQEYFIDAAIALLNSEEVDSLRNIDLPEVIGTVKLPSGRFTSRFTAFGDLCKSGRTTEFTENGCHARPNMYLRDTSYQLNARYPNLVNIVKQVSLCQGCFEASGVQDDLTRTLPPCSYCEEDRITLRDSVWWKNCLCIDTPYDPVTGERFSAEGDSGAVIFEVERDESLLGFGIIFAQQCHSFGPCTLASPLRPALETLSRNISQNASLRLLSKYND